jgi:hypothetical protein
MILSLTAAKDMGLVPQGGTLQSPLTGAVLGSIALLWGITGAGYLWTAPPAGMKGSELHLIFNVLLIPFMVSGILAVFAVAACSCGALIIPS